MVARVANTLRGQGHSVTEVKVDPGSWLLPFTILGMHLLVDDARPLEARERLEHRTQTALRTGSFINDRVLRWATARQRVITARTRTRL